MGARLGTAGAASIGFHINAAKMGADSVRYGPTNWWKYVVLVAVVGVKWLEQQPPIWRPRAQIHLAPGLFFSSSSIYGRVSLIWSRASLLIFL